VERLIRLFDVAGEWLDRMLPASRRFRLWSFFAMLWLVTTAAMYLIPGTRYSQESYSHISGHWIRSAGNAALLTFLGFLVYLWQNRDA
jgi:hypothetical protein